MAQTKLTSHALNTPKQDLRYYFLWLWGLVITASLVLSPRLGESGLLKFIRIDDILFPITVIITLSLIKYIYPVAKVIYAFLVLYLFNLIVLLITHYSGFNTVGIIEKLLPTLKNIQYLTYFCFFFITTSRLNNIKQIKYLFLTIFLCFTPNLFYALSQVVTLSFTGYYGLEIINERSPTLTGTVFHVVTILSSLLAQLEKKNNLKQFWIFLTIIHGIFTILTGSRGAFIALFTYFIVIAIGTLLNLILKSKISKHYIKIFLTLSITLSSCLFIILIIPSLSDQVESLLNLLPSRGLSVDVGSLGNEARVDNWSNTLSLYIDYVNQVPLLGLFGLGSGGIYEIFGMLLNAADSQYVYTIISGGLIGSLFYINAFVQLYKLGSKKTSKSILPLLPTFLGLFWSFMAFSISQEVFHLSKPGGLFWTMCGLLLGSACNKANQKRI